MNKEEFLQKLEQKLHVLNEQERRDVLEDYAQHIDLKIKNGQAEEEAVRSLGDPGELAAELLDVYHINSEYASDSHMEENTAGDLHGGQSGPAQKTGKKAHLAERLRRKTAVSSDAGREQKKAARMQKREERRLKREAGMKIRKERKRMNRNQREYRSERTIVSRALARLGSLLWACILFCWKACLFGAALPVMLLGAFCLFLGGVVLVLLLQGYPLVGVGIGTLGLTISSFGLTALILSWVFTGKKDRPAGNTAGEQEQDKTGTFVSVSQSEEKNALQPGDAQEFTEKTADKLQN